MGSNQINSPTGRLLEKKNPEEEQNDEGAFWNKDCGGWKEYRIK